jgi:predicted unusual protein kinase regulating ubiquinone biosynthesis (AarF/ABC1/UbiB family)
VQHCLVATRSKQLNIGRLGEIAQVAARHGFGYVFEGRRGREEEEGTPTARGRHLREMLDELGPTFVKFGQLLSTRPDVVPPDIIAELRGLQDDVKPFPFSEVERVIAEDFNQPISRLFLEFDEEPIAAASIGQVYRATLKDGREVAVKVQYPGVAGAVRADMQNLDMILRLLKRMTPGLDVKALAEEIKERIVEELDYELEAQNQRSLARIFAGHPFIVVPEVVGSLSRERVLVSEFVSGVGFEELKGRSQAERNRIGEIVFRFFLGCLYRHRQFSGDPHPGNFLLLEDGRMAFLDFGLFKRMDAEPVALELACQRAVSEGDAAKLHELLAASGFLPEPERVDPDNLLAFITDAIWWYTTADEEVLLSPEIATQVMIESSDPRSSHFREMRHQDMRPEHLFGRRMEMLTLAVLSQLRASANWHRIAREWMYGDEPVTELGREEADFYGRSSSSSVAARG